MTKIDKINNIQFSSNTWEELVDLLSQEAPVPFYQSNIGDFLDFNLENTIDLDLSESYTITFPTDTTWWNESLDTVARLVYQPNGAGNSNFTSYRNRMLTANAYSSSDPTNNNDDPCVMPWRNINGKSYVETRGSDIAAQAITNSNPSNPKIDGKNLQYTREAAGTYLRLIMPKYTRRVEIEDLNRDFWVIGQSITYLSRWLFEDIEGNPKDIFSKILNELLQLWENMIYLWGGAAILCNKKKEKKIITKTKVIYLPAPVKLFTERKFDNFTRADEGWDAVNFLRYKYTDCNLVIVPFYRKNNYYRNYFSEYRIHNIYIWDVNKETFYSVETGIDINLPENSNAKDRIYFMHEDSDEQITYGYPYSLLEHYQEEEQHKYYGMISVKPEIAAHYDTDRVVIDKFIIRLYDAVAETIDGSRNYIGQINKTITFNSSENSYDIEDNSSWTNLSINDEEPTVKRATFKGYMGEMISARGETQKPIIKNAKFKIVKIGDFLPIDINFNNMTPVPKDIDINAPLYSIEKAYDQATYGVGAYAYRTGDTEQQWQPTFSSNKINFLSYASNSLGRYPTNDITPDWLKELGDRYIRQLVSEEKLPNEVIVIATKIGVGYWSGDNGIQWEHGFVSDLFLYNPSEVDNPVQHMSKINLFDGFWTDDTSIFIDTEISGRWRRLGMQCDSIIVKKLNGVYTYTMKNGIMAWYDHAKEVYRNTWEDYHIRPYCSINIDSNGKLVYGAQHNIPSGTNMAMTGNFSNTSPIITKLIPPWQNCYAGGQSWNNASFKGGKDADYFIFD